MKFNSKSGQELRTWILFFVGIALAIIFAIKETPLNPWWTLIIGAFTCTAIIVSAVQALAGGFVDATRKAVDEARRDDPSMGSDKVDPSARSISVGPRIIGFVRGICSYHADPVSESKRRKDLSSPAGYVPLRRTSI